ncbi:HAD-IIB family hydrolase [Acidithiobacillus sp.]|uniref:HAD-IIB family hydrolase n=1 Tax=Acidithiobacillus sp. TaxID=1872118 RepID=UPI00263884ED|nr:HAD-IIB family hydrolase [Acidithiobacillus sp.]
MSDHDGLYILMLSIHGRICGTPELGVDADTGGQVGYVLDEMQALARDPRVTRINLLTRRFSDPGTNPIYGEPRESLGSGAQIIRLPAGPAHKYLQKERLWDYLDMFVDSALHFIRSEDCIPDVIHSHYADAGYVGVRLSRLLGIPLIHTGHSLGRDKRERLIAAGRKAESIDRQFHFSRRIAAEEAVLSEASVVMASTRQEVDEQYGLYENAARAHFMVLPPGVDLHRFSRPGRQRSSPLLSGLRRFLEAPRKPPILAIARPDERKNFQRLVEAYATAPDLREHANLVLIMGQRDRFEQIPHGAKRVIESVLHTMDDYDLYGQIALPKHHEPEDVPEYYRYAAIYKGVFVNPALTEPFGLTLLEAAASGLPIVATQHGGPQDIIRYCRNGILVDPLNIGEIQNALRQMLFDRRRWQRASRAGLLGVRRVYSWEAHARRYLAEMEHILRRQRKQRRREFAARQGVRRAVPAADHLLVSDIDNTLIGDSAGLAALMEWLREHPRVAFGVATGRNLKQTMEILAAHQVPRPDICITDVGTRIVYGSKLHEDQDWAAHLHYRWWREGVLQALADVPGLRLQEKMTQSAFKVSYYVDPKHPPTAKELQKRLHQQQIIAHVVLSHTRYLDILPIRASKGHAIRFLAFRWGLPLHAVLTAGDSGNDADMMGGEICGVVVGNHSPELHGLRGKQHIYFASAYHAWGILEGIQYYHFPGDAHV